MGTVLDAVLGAGPALAGGLAGGLAAPRALRAGRLGCWGGSAVWAAGVAAGGCVVVWLAA